MSQTLVIVESPSKAKTIGKYLGRDYQVKASVGHVRDLPASELGVDIEQDFAPKYVTIKGKEKVLRELKTAAGKADAVLLAPAPDREGEAIAWHIAQSLNIKDKPVHRISFNEITNRAVLEALEHPTELDQNKFYSQQARRILDRLVGYKLSPLLWKKVKRGLSAGRVQSVAVRLVVEREEEIEKFKPQEYWELYVDLRADAPPVFTAKVGAKDGKKLSVTNAEQAAAIAADLDAGQYFVDAINRKQQKKRPLPPFITSTLQQVASRRLRMSPSQIMRLAQQLYEGIDVSGDGPQGLITYMRTDSVRIAADAQQTAAEYIRRAYGDEYLPAKPPVYSSRKGAQEAHEAIRPTDLSLPPESLKGKLTGPQLKVYELIWKRFIASQMNPAEFEILTVQIANGPYRLTTSEQQEVFPGHLAAMRDDEETENDETPSSKLPPLSAKQELRGEKIDRQQKFTQPPARFTEATLIKELEEQGSGRPSTYAAILATILEKKYVEKVKGAAKKDQPEEKEEGAKVVKGGLRPTALGRSVTRLLIGSFPDVLNVSFTASMETQLDEVEEGRVDWHKLLADFWKSFLVDLEKAGEEMANLKREGETTDIKCEKCGSAMVIKHGRNGSFLACSNYPDCRNTKNYSRDDEGKVIVAVEEKVEVACDKCGSPMIKKTGRFGPFLACSAYPNCRNIVSLKEKAGASRPAEESDQLCPTCGGPMVLKYSRKGSRFHSCKKYPKCKGTLAFDTGVKCPKEGCDGSLQEKSGPRGVCWGCSNYPKCRVTFRAEPVDRHCPQCDNHFLLRRKSGEKTVLSCPNRECNYEVVENEGAASDHAEE